MKRLAEVYGKRLGKTGEVENVPVGSLHGQHPIGSNVFEVLTFEFNDEYNGSNIVGGEEGNGIFTYVRTTTGSDRDIVSPICVVTSSYTIPLYILASGILTKVEGYGTDNKRSPVVTTNGSCDIVIVTPGKQANMISEWNIRLPYDIRIDRKIIHIKKFNIYISGCSGDNLRNMMNISNHRISSDTHTLARISIKANISFSKIMNYSLNGLPGQVVVEPSRSPTASVTVEIAGETLVWEIPNKDIIAMSGPLYHFWPMFGGVELVMSDDYDSMLDFQATIKGSYSNTTADLIQKMRDEISGLNEAIMKRDQIIALNKQRMQQEEHKTIREEIKLKSELNSNRHSEIVEWLKIGGAAMGTLALIVNISSKLSSSKPEKSKLIEWSIPIMMKKGLVPSDPLVSSVGLLGCSLLIGIGILANELVNELES